MAACTVYLVGVWHANRQRARILAESSGHLAEDGDKTEDLGDLAPTYRYIY